MKITNVLLATDLSEESERPYAEVAQLAERFGATVTLLHVLEDVITTGHGAPLVAPISSPLCLPDRDEVCELLEQHAAKLRASVDAKCEVKCDVIGGIRVAEAITKYAGEHGVDLLAVSTHGRSGFRRMMMGSVAELVVRHSPVPVLVFPRLE